MATINFLIRSEKNPARVHVRVREGRDIDVKAPTNLLVNPAEWSFAKGTPKNSKSEVNKKLVLELETLRSLIVASLNKRKPGEKINTQWFKDLISQPEPEVEKTTQSNELVKYFDIYIEFKKGESTKSTIKKAKVVQGMVKRMQEANGKRILIENVDLYFKAEFEKYCIEDGYAQNTIARALKFIKTVCMHARTHGLKTHHQLDAIKGKFHAVKHIHLTFDELSTIAVHDFQLDFLSNARDWLLISCYTGQRVSDFLRFEKSMIRTEKRVRIIEFTQKKTGKIMAIPLHPVVEKILRKRNGEFPRKISDQKYNCYIKRVCKEAGLTQKVEGGRKNPQTGRKETGKYEKWELVASHIGRRSFATNFYGIAPTPVLKAVTGHSSERQLLAYIGKSETEQAKQLIEYFNHA